MNATNTNEQKPHAHTPTLDAITQAEANHVEISRGKVIAWRGPWANKLINSPDFTASALNSSACFQVWEVTQNTYDWRTDASQHVCILRACQRVLSTDSPRPATGALDYMGHAGRVLVYNRDVEEREELACDLYEQRRRIYDDRGTP